uniref:Uncharacterized protein n=1 Tax=Oryza rufipogon TaxID=4529 RepID=A0A0E0NXR2_ORYRU
MYRASAEGHANMRRCPHLANCGFSSVMRAVPSPAIAGAATSVARAVSDPGDGGSRWDVAQGAVDMPPCWDALKVPGAVADTVEVPAEVIVPSIHDAFTSSRWSRS